MHIRITKEAQRRWLQLLLDGHGLAQQFFELVTGIIHIMVDHFVLYKLVLLRRGLKQMLFGYRDIGNGVTERECGYQVIGDDKMTGR